LLDYMDDQGYEVARPVHPEGGPARPLLNLKSGYVERAAAILPKQGDKPPWMIRQNYILDWFTAKYADVSDQMRFDRRDLVALATAGEGGEGREVAEAVSA
jgi:hypothetical protein